MEKWKKRALDLMTSLAFGGNNNPSVVPYYPQKTEIGKRDAPFFRRTIPEKQGISSKRICSMLSELEAEKRANLHSIMVIVGGEVICECSADGYDTLSWHISHSMAKTIVGMVIGCLVSDGVLSLDSRICEILSEIPYKDKRFQMITVDHLLSMTAGVEFAELGSVTETNWTEAFFSSSVRFTPGTRFLYNSMNSYILAKIAERVSETRFSELVRDKIFDPLGIDNYLWEVGPEGTTKAGWGLYMSPESWAKVGYMLMRGGEFMGRRVLSFDWIKLSTESKVTVPEINGGFNYAYQIWTARSGGELLFNGLFGQNVWICPKNDILVVMTAGNNELFQASPSLEIVRKYLGGEIKDEVSRRDYILLGERERRFFETRRWVRPKKSEKGLLGWLGILPREPFDYSWCGALGNFAFGNNNVGIFPLVLRAMQNNMRCELGQISIIRVREELWLCYFESEVEYKIKVGLYRYEPNELNIHGEKYMVMAMGEAVFDEEGRREYRIDLLFTETASRRMITIRRPAQDRIILELFESPNNRVVENWLARYIETYPKLAMEIGLVERRLGEGVVSKMIKNSFNPTLVGANIDMDGYAEIIDAENKKTAENSRSLRLIKMLVERFLREGDDRAKKEENQDQRKQNPIEHLVRKIVERAKNEIKK